MAGYKLDDAEFDLMLKGAKKILDASQGLVVHQEKKEVTRIQEFKPTKKVQKAKDQSEKKTLPKVRPGHPAKHKGGTVKSGDDLDGGKGEVDVVRWDTCKMTSLKYISEFRSSKDMVDAFKFWLTNKRDDITSLMQQPSKEKVTGTVTMFRPIEVSFIFFPKKGLSVYKGTEPVTKATFKYSGAPVFAKVMSRKRNDKPHLHVQTIFPELSSEEVERLLKKDNYVLRR